MTKKIREHKRDALRHLKAARKELAAATRKARAGTREYKAVSNQDLADQLDIADTGIWTAIEDLQEAGTKTW